ncbi:nodulation protein NfeD [Candidatus Acetothermia bacterium]|nr:nodulation protein NfeD [Candidatus Acetothermia bacterium]MBI3642796.1 nodulation protein NfeD [Candidatus Acetothermia bacterium]
MRKAFSYLSLGFVVCCIAAVLTLSAFAEPTSTGNGPIHILKLKASINPITKDYLVGHIQKAEAEGAALVLIELDTPGGLVSSTQEIVEAMLNSTVPVIVWVGPAGAWAASAGTFITMSANIASMAPGATIGAAHPINIDGTSPGTTPSPAPTTTPNDNSTQQPASGDAVTQKITNFTATWAREIAKVRGRNQDWAEQAVRTSVTAGADKALELKIIDIIASSPEELLQKVNGYALSDGRVLKTEGVARVEYPMSWREQLLNYLADPNLVYILLTIGVLALTYEFLSPSIGLGFVVGGISLLLAFMGLQILPVNIVGLGLLLFGMLLLTLDIFSPTHGILTTGGVLALLAGSFTLFEVPEVQMQLSILSIISVVGTITLIFVFVLTKGLMIQRRVPVTGMEGMIGAIGRVSDSLSPHGRVFVRGEYWFADSSDGQPIQAKEEIVVEKLENGKLLVRRRVI